MLEAIITHKTLKAYGRTIAAELHQERKGRRNYGVAQRTTIQRYQKEILIQ